MTEEATPALHGIRILDFTHVLAGPFATMVLTDLGADVLKIENPAGGDLARRSGGDQFGTYYGSLNRGKKGAVIDLKQEAGRELARRLAEKADVVVQNSFPGSFERMGLGYEALSAANPRLIYASVTGFGQDGPWADRAGTDPLIQGLCGLMSITGELDGPPSRVGYSSTDVAGGAWLAIAILTALYERERSGKGQFIDISLLEAQMAFMENAIVRALNGGEAVQRNGSARHAHLVTKSYQTSDGWMMTEFEDRKWEAVCNLLGHPEWLDNPEMKSPEWNPVTDAALREVIITQPTAHWVTFFDPIGVAVRPVKTVHEGVELPPLVERNFIQETVDSNGRLLRIASSPLRLSRTPGKIRGAAPLLGEHTRSGLQEWIDISDAELDELEKQGLFEERPVETQRRRRELFF